CALPATPKHNTKLHSVLIHSLSLRSSMNFRIHHRVTAMLFAVTSLAAAPASAQAPLSVTSPDARTEVDVGVREGHLYYSIQRDGRALFLPSQLGFEFRSAPIIR